MSYVIECPSCARQLRLPEELLTRTVKCPSCEYAFVANVAGGAQAESTPAAGQADGPARAPAASNAAAADTGAPADQDHPAPRDESPAPRPKPTRKSRERDEDDYEPCPYCREMIGVNAVRCRFCGEYLDDDLEDEVRRDSEPDRGGLVLTLGICSIVAAIIPCVSPVGLILGIVSWVMGQRDMRKMDANEMDPRGRGNTQGGRICGIVGTALGGISTLGCVAYFAFIGAMVNQAAKMPGPPLATGPAPVVVAPSVEVAVQNEDYAQVRARFKTRLIQRGRAPQQWMPLTPPPEAKEVTFPSGTLSLKAWINPPAEDGGATKPAVVFLHSGFAFDFEDWTMTKPFRDAGYVVMTPILRGENGQAGDHSLYYDEVEDALAAADYLAKQKFVDPKRLYVAGHGSGGTLAMLSAMTSNRFRAAASFTGYVDLNSARREGLSTIRFNQNDQSEIQVRSPLAYAQSFKCPARLYYASDEFLLAGPTQRTAQLARAKGQDVTAVAVPGNTMTSLPGAMKQCIDFFRKLEK